MNLQVTDEAITSQQPLAAAVASSVSSIALPASSRILFGIVSPEQVDEMRASAMESGGLSLGYPPPVFTTAKDPAARTALNLTGPLNMSSGLRPGGSVRRLSRPPEPGITVAGATTGIPSTPALSQAPTVPQSEPVASTSKAVQSASEVAELPATEPVPSRLQYSVGSPIELGTARVDATADNGRPPSALTLKHDHSPLATGRSVGSVSSPTSPRSPLAQQAVTPPRIIGPPISGVSFSRALKPPIGVPGVMMVDERPAKATRTPRSSLRSSLPPATSPSDTPLASSDADVSTAPTSPLLKSSSPPTRTTSPKPVLKPKLWADLLKSPPAARKRVSIALPPSDEGMSPPTSPSSGGPTIIRSPSKKAGLPPKPTAAIQVPSAPSVMNQSIPINVPVGIPLPPPIAYAPTPPSSKRRLEEVLRGVENRHTAPSIQPRGLTNRGNQCFENSILQCLLFCAPFYNLLRLLAQETSHDYSRRYACLEAMIAFAEEFTIGKRDEATPSQHGHLPHKPTLADAFAPEMVYEALRSDRRFEVMMRGSQEDAQEFLGFLLDSLHEELLALLDESDGLQPTPLVNGTMHTSGDDDGWLEVGSKGRMATTRSIEGRDSPITRIFAGKQRSTLRVPGQKDSATVEPFLTLQLDIAPDSVETIDDAIANICTTDTLSDYTARPGVRVEASKQLSLEALPPVLILHLKRFSYDGEAETTLKDHKVIGFGTELDISPSWLSPGARSSAPIRYALSAVVYHHGRNATGGHYTVSLRKQDGQWIHIDDTAVYDVGPADVAVDRTDEVLRLSLPSAMDGIPERTAYLLFWTRIS